MKVKLLCSTTLPGLEAQVDVLLNEVQEVVVANFVNGNGFFSCLIIYKSKV